MKLRAKLAAPPREGERLFYGVNVEVGRVPAPVEQEGWSNEIRPIVGWRDGTWLLAVNPSFGYALAGPQRFRVELLPAAKVAWNTRAGFSVGAEWYGELGYADALLPLSRQAHYLLAVLDLAAAPGRPDEPWELNLAAGAGLGGADQKLLVKAIVGRSF